LKVFSITYLTLPNKGPKSNKQLIFIFIASDKKPGIGSKDSIRLYQGQRGATI
jgi:hypothetical protein